MAKPRPLTPKQLKFIKFYCGNATDAARKAGYKSPKLSGHENMTKPNILKLIKNREDKRNNPKIKSREQRQAFWSKMMDNAEKDSDQLKASELLGRSEADFTDKILAEHKIDNWTDEKLADELARKTTELRTLRAK